jgi:DNA-binding transcriptional ArsR family regulator
MVELVKPDSKVRDLTEAPRHIPIEVDGASVYEVIVTLWTTFNEKEAADSFELGSDWRTSLIESTPDDLRAEIELLGGPYCSVWLSLMGLAASAPHPHSPENVFDWLARINPQRMRRWMLEYMGQQADPALVEQAANGDLDAVRKIVGENKPSSMADHVASLFEIEAEEMRDRLIAALIRFHKEVFSAYEEEFGGAIGRAAAARRALASRDDVKTVIEDVTNGLEYEVPIGVRRVILIPSVVIRPLSLIDLQRDTLLVLYAMADEFLDSDPEAPPSWLIKTYKALSDERRLRILRRLAEGPTSLDELTKMLGLSKSTVHHHISILRAAGLIRVQIPSQASGKEKTSYYSLRPQTLTSAGDFLDSYIRTDDDLAHQA